MTWTLSVFCKLRFSSMNNGRLSVSVSLNAIQYNDVFFVLDNRPTKAECAAFSFDGEECRSKLIGVAAGGGGALALLIIITALIIRHRRAGTNLRCVVINRYLCLFDMHVCH